ncbi:MAG: energy transducer TonB [Muribaculaceae bacterium]|nr:energy transducer TonB [Muribaculaceae bacterium]
MNIRALTLIAVSAFAIATTQNVFSQTCKIKSSTSINGCTVYTEVYEYDYVEQKPEFPGGRNSMINFINATREYPSEAYENGIEGRVTCAFVVNPDGKVCHVQVLRGVESTLNQEAIRIISRMPDWSPGKIAEQPVPTRVVCCIPFRK